MYLKIDNHKKLRELSSKTPGHPSLRTNIDPRVIHRRTGSAGSERGSGSPTDELSEEAQGFSGKPFGFCFKLHRVSTERPMSPPKFLARKQSASKTYKR